MAELQDWGRQERGKATWRRFMAVWPPEGSEMAEIQGGRMTGEREMAEMQGGGTTGERDTAEMQGGRPCLVRRRGFLVKQRGRKPQEHPLSWPRPGRRARTTRRPADGSSWWDTTGMGLLSTFLQSDSGMQARVVRTKIFEVVLLITDELDANCAEAPPLLPAAPAPDQRHQPPPPLQSDASDHREQLLPQNAPAGGRLQCPRGNVPWTHHYSPRPEVVDASGWGRDLELGDPPTRTDQNRGSRCTRIGEAIAPAWNMLKRLVRYLVLGSPCSPMRRRYDLFNGINIPCSCLISSFTAISPLQYAIVSYR